MPCGGPSKEHAYKQGDKIADEVLEYLRLNHAMSKGHLVMKVSKEEWEAESQKLRAAIREMIWIDHAEF
jgi:hypothetical protein